MRARQKKTKIQTGVGNDQKLVTTYDSGYEHSPEHWLELEQQVEEEDYERPAARSQAG